MGILGELKNVKINENTKHAKWKSWKCVIV